jgi:acetate kinase
LAKSILIMNSGSSSLKFELYAYAETGFSVLTKGLVERIGESGSRVKNHSDAIEQVVLTLESSGHLGSHSLAAIGHRVVHGGEHFRSASRINDEVIAGIRAAASLAPLHNPPNLLGIEACRERWPEVPQVAVFDTAFHQTLPVAAYRYAIPDVPGQGERVRRYGFHGTSFASIRRQVAAYLDRDAETLNLIVLHLGNGASACAIRSGCSVDTSMGMTPTAGLVMGTRSGDVDPGVLLHWLRQEGLDVNALDRRMNHESGLKGLSGTNDMRELMQRIEAGSPDARMALDVYIHRLRHYVGAYRAALPELDALVFTGGIGEHAPQVRSETLADLAHLGFRLDEAINAGFRGDIGELQHADSMVRIMVAPASEEREIAIQTAEVLQLQGQD